MTTSPGENETTTNTPARQQPYTGQKAEAAAADAKAKQNQDPRQGLPANVVVQENQPLMELQPADPNAEGPWIQYNGVGTVRIMDESDWARQGIDSKNYYEWNPLNRKRLPRSVFTDAELTYLLRHDGRFSLVEDEPEKESATT